MKKKDKVEKNDEIENIDIENLEEIEKENIESIAKNLKQVKCPKCGYLNFELTKKCTKCRYDLDFVNKSCPKCGKRNANAVNRCECGFNFNRNKRSLLTNLIITIIVMVLLFVGYNFFGDLIKEYDILIKTVLVYVVFVILCKTFISSNPVEGFSAEQEMLEKFKRKENPVVIRNVLIILGAVAALIFLIYYYYFR
jgi:Ca2+/Na+ antiporter